MNTKMLAEINANNKGVNMKVNYINTSEDLWEYIILERNRNSIKELRKKLIYAVLVIGLNILLIFREEFPLIFLEIVGLAIYIPILIYNKISFKKRVLSSFHKDDGILGEHTIELLDEGFREYTAVNDSYHKWNGVKTIDSNKSYLMIILKNNTFFLIPKNAFKSNEDAYNFEQYVTNKLIQCG